MIFLRSFLWLGFLLAAVLASVAPGRAATLALTPAADTSIIESVPDNNLGHAWLTVGTLNNAGRSRSLLRFDLSGLPAGSTLQSATLSLTVTKQPPGGASSNFRLHRLLQPWFEGGQGSPGVGVGAPAAAGDTTWNHRASATAAWSSPGAGSPLDFASAPSSSATASSAATISFPSSAQLVADLQAWFQNPTANLGWLIVSDAESTAGTAKRLGSRETAGAEPVLAIQYQPPAPVVTPPSISQQPQGISVNLGAQVGFSVVATGTAPFSYQWQFNGTDVPELTSASVVLGPVTAAHAGTYRVRVSNAAGAITSADATLSLDLPPSISVPPPSRTVAPGATTTFSVVAAGSPPLAYQWQFKGADLPGATGPDLVLPNVTPDQAGAYRVRVSNAAGAVTSPEAVLTLQLPPSISSQPQGRTVNPGTAVTFSVGVSGTGPFSYQWQFQGLDLPAATQPELALPSVSPDQAGAYRVRVSNAGGAVTSTDALLAVNLPPSISSHPESRTVNLGGSVSFSVVASGTGPFSYQWQFKGLDLPGANQPELALPAVAADQAGTYRVRVSNAAGAVTSTDALLAVVIPPSITTQPASRTVRAGSSATLSVAASGSAPLAYQWQFKDADIPGATRSDLVLPAITPEQAGAYHVRISNAAGSVTSADAVLTVTVAPSITSPPTGRTANSGAATTFSVVAAGTAPLAYQWQFKGVDLPGANGPELVLPAVTPEQAGAYRVRVSNPTGTITSPDAVLVVVVLPVLLEQPESLTVNPGARTSFSVTAEGRGLLSYQWQFNGVDLPGATNPDLVVGPVTADRAGAYRVRVTNADGSVTSAEAVLTVRVTPAITAQPVDRTVAEGEGATFTVAATGTGPLNYQWLFKGTDIAGETKSELVIPAAGETQEGDYQVRVSNEAGRVLSAPARLAITRTPPAAPRLRDWTLAGDVIRFDFDAEPRRTYVVEVSAAPAEPVWQTLRTFEPQTAARTITVTDVRPAGARFYRVMAR